MKKTILTMALAAAMALTLCGCGGSAGSSSSSSSAAESSSSASSSSSAAVSAAAYEVDGGFGDLTATLAGSTDSSVTVELDNQTDDDIIYYFNDVKIGNSFYKLSIDTPPYTITYNGTDTPMIQLAAGEACTIEIVSPDGTEVPDVVFGYDEQDVVTRSNGLTDSYDFKGYELTITKA